MSPRSDTSPISNPAAAISLVLVAAGSSRRMGLENKLLLPWTEKTLIEASLAPFLGRGFGELIAVVGHDAEAVTSVLAPYPVRVVHNPDHGRGLGSSLAAGIAACSADAVGFLVALGDMPRIPHDLPERLIAAFSRDPQHIVVPVREDRKGHPVLFGAAYRPGLLELDGDRGARSILAAHSSRLVAVPVSDDGIFFDVDGPADLPT
ncbi:Nucleotidyltransferase family protein [Sulfidibacter corallicola]|uniref:Nucleotidyltransferase family protein n=1 Tax=Sulfidibacter corallicola TaxID=2818388 RepID=A0A8A4TU40_SULCO|nr:nucleotidyltransferase family protein [Sulfidibacter corallicola]QTD52887.1 nucleotidyltransferase family protein [Sulfidibacter corallicola]